MPHFFVSQNEKKKRDDALPYVESQTELNDSGGERANEPGENERETKTNCQMESSESRLRVLEKLCVRQKTVMCPVCDRK